MPAHLQIAFQLRHLLRPLALDLTSIAVHEDICIQARAADDVEAKSFGPDLLFLRRDVAVFGTSSSRSMAVDDLREDSDAPEIAGRVTAHVLDAEINGRVPG